MPGKVFFFGLALLFLAGCAAPAPETGVSMGGGVTLHWPPQGALDRPRDADQSVVIAYPGGTVAIEGRLEASADHVRLVCLDPLGRRALSADWTAQGAQFETAPWVPSLLRPENVLADLIVIYWPQTAVEKALPGATVVGEGTRRTVRLDGRDILQADYTPGPDGTPWSGKTVYRNIPWHYTLTIQSAEVDP